MVSHAMLFIILSSLSVLCVARTKSPFQHSYEEYLPITCSTIVLILFGFGLIGMLSAGVYIVCALSVLMYAISLLIIVRRKSYRTFFKGLFTPGFFIFSLVYIVLTILHDGRMLHVWDEFSYWGDVVKVMFQLDDFSTNEAAYSFFKSYVPGMPLFQYFFQKIHQMLDGYSGFSEWRLIFAYQVFAFSFFFPFFKKSSYKHIVLLIVSFALMCLTPTLFFWYYYPRSIYIDPFVGIMAGSGFAYLYVNRKKDTLVYVHLLLTMMMLTLAKDVGMMFAGFIAAALIIDEAFFSKKKERKWILHLTAKTVGIALAVWIPKYLWNMHYTARNVGKAFGNPIRLDSFIDVIRGKDTTYRSEVLRNYADGFFSKTISMSAFEIEISYFAIVLMLIVGLVVIHCIVARGEKEEEKSRRMIVCTALLLTILYSIGLCVLYMSRFSVEEAVRIAGFDRYYGMLLLMLLIMILLITYDYVRKNPARLSDIGMLAIMSVILALPVDSVQAFLNRNSVGTSIAIRQPYEHVARHVLDLTQNKAKKVYIISQESSDFDYYVLHYSMQPCISHYSDWSANPEKPQVNEWKSLLKEYDYVVLYELGERFADNYGVLFENKEDIREHAVYEVNQQTGLLFRCM